MTAAPVPHRTIPVLLKHGGTQLQTSRPTPLVDIAKWNPFNILCGSGWFARIEKRGSWGRIRWFLSVPSSSLPLSRVQRLRAAPLRQQCLYMPIHLYMPIQRLSGLLAFRIGQTSKLNGTFAQNSVGQTALGFVDLPGGHQPAEVLELAGAEIVACGGCQAKPKVGGLII
jgi:hypothetical protein